MSGFRVAACVFLTCAFASATDRYYSDVKAASANGKFEAEAVSPQNAGGGRRAFQDEFTVSLKETACGRWSGGSCGDRW
ncbi:MAG: hypothetical protein FD180_1093 [Planctomycetota bacterium]|nr:MAG: hypothetical protein FD180_1093 [Planctomycetota bacterium]